MPLSVRRISMSAIHAESVRSHFESIENLLLAEPIVAFCIDVCLGYSGKFGVKSG